MNEPPVASDRQSGRATQQGNQPIVRVVGVSKAFGGVQALNSVDVAVARGSIHALVGENGAGKSTLGRVFSGVLTPDQGEVLVDAEPVRLLSPRHALAHGIATIEQEVALVPGLTVRDNVLLGNEPRRLGFVRRRELEHRCDALLAESGFKLNPAAIVGALPLGAQQQVEIVRALSRQARLVVMDEPTAALDDEEVRTLHSAIRALANGGTSVLLVSHFLREVLALADTITVLRDGSVVHTRSAADETEGSLILAMLGRSLGSVFPVKRPAPIGTPVVLSARQVKAPGVHEVSLDVAAGEIVGLAGLGGAGRSELAKALYGSAHVRSGEVSIVGQAVRKASPRTALRRGLSMIPESRKEEGLLTTRSILENVSISTLSQVATWGLLRPALERRLANELLQQLDVPVDRGTSKVSTLSGGNQQKVLFARMLRGRPAVLIADEPTRGVDIGAKAAIYSLLCSLAEEGMGVLLISSEIEELIGLAHRVVVLHQGRVSAELSGTQLSESEILGAAFGKEHAVQEGRS